MGVPQGWEELSRRPPNLAGGGTPWAMLRARQECWREPFLSVWPQEERDDGGELGRSGAGQSRGDEAAAQLHRPGWPVLWGGPGRRGGAAKVCVAMQESWWGWDPGRGWPPCWTPGPPDTPPPPVSCQGSKIWGRILGSSGGWAGCRGGWAPCPAGHLWALVFTSGGRLGSCVAILFPPLRQWLAEGYSWACCSRALLPALTWSWQHWGSWWRRECREAVAAAGAALGLR